MIRFFAKFFYIQAMLTMIAVAALGTYSLAETDFYPTGPDALLGALMWGMCLVIASLGLLGVALAIAASVFAKIDKAHDIGALGSLFAFEGVSIALLATIPKSYLFEVSEHLFLVIEIVCLTFFVAGVALMLISMTAPKQQAQTVT